MIISRTPFRVSFFGGGTDMPQWYRENGGAILSTTIDKYCYISVRYLPPFFEYKHRIVYRKIEMVKTAAEIRHPTVKASLDYLKMEKGLEIHHDADLPARSGLGSSSAFTVGLLNALEGLEGRLIAKRDLAARSIHIERDMVKEVVGVQDQIAASYGGLNHIEIRPDDSFGVTPIIISKERKEEFGRHLMLFFTGFARSAPLIEKLKVENFSRKRTELLRMRSLVDEGLKVLQSRTTPITEFGRLLNEGWLLKRSLARVVSSNEIDKVYEDGIRAGATGGKLLGAGGGGFMLFFVKPEYQKRVRYKLRRLFEVPFRFETSGSKIALYDPQMEF